MVVLKQVKGYTDIIRVMHFTETMVVLKLVFVKKPSRVAADFTETMVVLKPRKCRNDRPSLLISPKQWLYWNIYDTLWSSFPFLFHRNNGCIETFIFKFFLKFFNIFHRNNGCIETEVYGKKYGEIYNFTETMVVLKQTYPLFIGLIKRKISPKQWLYWNILILSTFVPIPNFTETMVVLKRFRRFRCIKNSTDFTETMVVLKL